MVFLWGISTYPSSVCIFVCAVYLQPAVPISSTDLGSFLLAVGARLKGSVREPLALLVIRNLLQLVYPEHHSSDGCGALLDKVTRLALISTFKCIFIIADH